MNLCALGSLLEVATSLLGGGGSTGANALPGGAAPGRSGSSNGASDPFSAIMALTGEADSLATGGLGSFAGGAFAGSAGAGGLLGSIAGLLA